MEILLQVRYSPNIALREWHLLSRKTRLSSFHLATIITLNIIAEMDAPQPNFQNAAQCLHIVANELGNCESLPAVRGGEAILEAIRQSELRLTRAM